MGSTSGQRRRPQKYPVELRERAVRMVFEVRELQPPPTDLTRAGDLTTRLHVVCSGRWLLELAELLPQEVEAWRLARATLLDRPGQQR